MYKQDEAVSSVVGLMLALAIIATVLAIYSATYLPGLKQQSEIEHTLEVQDAFARFGAEIEHATDQRTACQFSEPFSLGGGDVLLSPGKSSGTLSVSEEESPLAEVFFNVSGGSVYNASLVSIAYRPSFTTWEPQGYTWRYGFINVTRGSKETPLLAFTMDDVREHARRSAFAGSFAGIHDRTSPSSQDCTDLAVTLVRMRPGAKPSVTGNGMANLHLSSTVQGGGKQQTAYLEVRENRAIALPEFAEAVNCSVGTVCTGLADRYPNVAYDGHGLRFPDPAAPVNVTVQTLEIEVSAR